MRIDTEKNSPENHVTKHDFLNSVKRNKMEEASGQPSKHGNQEKNDKINNKKFVNEKKVRAKFTINRTGTFY